MSVTARDLILHEAFAGDGLVMAARVGEDPGPERFASIHAALREFYQISRANTAVERDLALALHLLAYETETRYRQWQRDDRSLREDLFDHDLPRLAAAVASILEGRWQESR